MKDTAFLYVISEPPELFSEDYPLISSYALIKREPDDGGDPHFVIYFEEDDEIITDPQEIIQIIHFWAPLAQFKGAVGVTIKEEEA